MNFLKMIFASALLFSFSAHAEEVQTEAIKTAIANEIEKTTENWYSDDENVGSIWVKPYESDKQAFSFQILEWVSKSHMVVNTSFICGSEYDESEFECACEVEVIKDKDAKEWVAILDNLDKCSMDFY